MYLKTLSKTITEISEHFSSKVIENSIKLCRMENDFDEKLDVILMQYIN